MYALLVWLSMGVDVYGVKEPPKYTQVIELNHVYQWKYDGKKWELVETEHLLGCWNNKKLDIVFFWPLNRKFKIIDEHTAEIDSHPFHYGEFVETRSYGLNMMEIYEGKR